MLQACLNGGLANSVHAGVLVSASELAADARSVRAAGAAELHVHVRDRAGAETLDRDAAAACLTAIREAVPACRWASARAHGSCRVVARDIGTCARGPSFRTIARSTSRNRTELRSLTCCTRTASALRPARFICDVAFSTCLRVLIEMTGNDAAEAVPRRDRLRAAARRGLQTADPAARGRGRKCLQAARLGCATWVGFEDGLQLRDGTLAENNAALVREAVAILRMLASAAR
jgi:uncharacterized protein (DUF849 family)